MNSMLDALLISGIVTPERAEAIEAEKRKTLSKKYSLEKDFIPKVKQN